MLRIRTGFSALAVCAVLAACTDQAGVMEDIDVTLRQTNDILTQAVSGWYASVSGTDGATAAIDKDTVESLVVRVTDIQFLPVENAAAEADAGAWVPLMLTNSVLLDLMSLPTEGESPLMIASGTVLVGEYNNVRFFTDSAAIVFKGPIDLGGGFSFEGGEVYQVTIPSGGETGIKTDANFTVVEGVDGTADDVNLLFSPGATFLNVTGTGTGEVILAPVIRSRPDGS